MNDRFLDFVTSVNHKIVANSKDSGEAIESNRALRTSIMSQKAATDLIEDHNHRMQQSIIILESKIRMLQDQIVGFKINLPENISISIGKETKSAITRNKQEKAQPSKQNDKVLRKKTKPSGTYKRNIAISSK